MASAHRQDEGEGAALVHDGVHGEAGFHLFGQLIDHREAQAGAAADGQGFGGEEGLEDAGQVFGRDAGAEVLDGNGDVAGGWRGRQHQVRGQLVQRAAWPG